MLLVLYTGLASLFLVLSYDLQPGLGWSPIKAALSWLGWPIGITLTSGAAQRFGAGHGLRLIQAGLIVMTAGMLLLITLMTGAGAAVSWWQVTVPTLVMGFGMGLCVPILTSVVLAGVPPHSAGAGSGVTNAILQLGAAAGIAVIGMGFFGLTTGGAGAAADSATPQLRQQLAAAGVPAGIQQETARTFRRCFQMQERPRTGTAVPPGCQAADPRVEAALRKATRAAQADNSAAATSTTLWYNAGVFVLAAALTPLIRPARRAEQEPASVTR
jgi:MFS family permease